MIRLAALAVALALLVIGCRSEEDQTGIALAEASTALAPFAAAAAYIPPATPDGYLVMCIPVSINGQYVTDYCLTAGAFRKAVEALNAIEEVD